MSLLGYKHTSSHPKSKSALPPKADVRDRTSAFPSTTPPDAQDSGVVGPDDLNDIRCRDGFSGSVPDRPHARDGTDPLIIASDDGAEAEVEVHVQMGVTGPIR
jgi:hypothetical protein